MRIFDPKFQNNKMRYLLQTAIGAVAVAAALLIFDIVDQPVIIASLGASGFVAFSAPQRRVAGPRHLIGGYIIGIAVGCALHYLAIFPAESYGYRCPHFHSFIKIRLKGIPHCTEFLIAKSMYFKPVCHLFFLHSGSTIIACPSIVMNP